MGNYTLAGYRIFTRREIIELWSKQDDKRLDSYCCPICRDILKFDDDGKFFCKNIECKMSEYTNTELSRDQKNNSDS